MALHTLESRNMKASHMSWKKNPSEENVNNMHMSVRHFVWLVMRFTKMHILIEIDPSFILRHSSKKKKTHWSLFYLQLSFEGAFEWVIKIRVYVYVYWDEQERVFWLSFQLPEIDSDCCWIYSVAMVIF